MRAPRAGSISSAVTRASARSSSRCAVLPPGAAQASSTRGAATSAQPSSSKGAARWAVADCTDSSPAAKPGRSCTARGRSSRRAAPPSARTPAPCCARRAHTSATLARRGLTRRSIGAACWAADRMACQWSGWSRRSRSTHQRGWFQRATESCSTAAVSASRSRRKRRRQALMKAACGRSTRSRLAASTAWSTRVKASYGAPSAGCASARLVHNSASTAGGGARRARRARNARASPSQRSA